MKDVKAQEAKAKLEQEKMEREKREAEERATQQEMVFQVRKNVAVQKMGKKGGCTCCIWSWEGIVIYINILCQYFAVIYFKSDLFLYPKFIGSARNNTNLISFCNHFIIHSKN